MPIVLACALQGPVVNRALAHDQACTLKGMAPCMHFFFDRRVTVHVQKCAETFHLLNLVT